METIAYKVNNGKVNLYKQGETSEIFNEGRSLISRATSKGFKMTSKAQGNCGVHLTYSDGKTRVTLYFFYSQNELDNFNFFCKPAWNGK